MNTPRAPLLPQPVAWLGYGGLVPFLGLAVLLALDPERQGLWLRGLVAYGAVILSFVGALHWAFAMVLPGLGPEQGRGRFVWSVVPALLGWLAVWLATPYAVAFLLVGFVAHYGQDRRLVAACPLPDWYLPLRGRLTTVACLSLAVSVWLAAR